MSAPGFRIQDLYELMRLLEAFQAALGFVPAPFVRVIEDNNGTALEFSTGGETAREDVIRLNDIRTAVLPTTPGAPMPENNVATFICAQLIGQEDSDV